MERPEPPTALFCTSDTIAHQILDQARESGIKVPGDLSVVGYYNMEGSNYYTPGLSTVDTGLMEMGAVGFKRLLDRLNGVNNGPDPRYKIVLPGTLVERDSHGSII
jgi:DNA-binding LacI/PurR family transcriptional regulator